MKYLNLIWKLVFWNIVCFIGAIVFWSFFSGEPQITLMLTLVTAPIIGTIGGIVEYRRSQNKKVQRLRVSAVK